MPFGCNRLRAKRHFRGIPIRPFKMPQMGLRCLLLVPLEFLDWDEFSLLISSPRCHRIHLSSFCFISRFSASISRFGNALSTIVLIISFKSNISFDFVLSARGKHPFFSYIKAQKNINNFFLHKNTRQFARFEFKSILALKIFWDFFFQKFL